MDRFWLALGFLTTLPVPPAEYEPGGLGRAAAWFPVVGLLIGVLLVALHAVAQWLFGPLPGAVLVVAGWAMLTGGLHLDGLADCCDGLLASVDRQRRLEIMRDPRTGSFAVVGLVLALMAKVAAVYVLPAAVPGLLLAPTLARWWILVAALRPLARPGGLGSSFASALTRTMLVKAALVPALLLAASLLVDWRSLLSAALAGLACLGVLRLAQARIGGVTGDVYGAVVELSEIALLLGMVRP
jgi:adenosylcobinamide-GDP ribazoletransferase